MTITAGVCTIHVSICAFESAVIVSDPPVMAPLQSASAYTAPVPAVSATLTENVHVNCAPMASAAGKATDDVSYARVNSVSPTKLVASGVRLNRRTGVSMF